MERQPAATYPEFTEGKDAYVYMAYRRIINDFAEKPVDFNLEGMVAAKRYSELTSEDAILDVGCSSGEFMLRAAQEAQIPAYCIGLDTIDYSGADQLRRGVDASRFSFMLGNGENIPLPDNAVKVLTAHNVLFRSHNVNQMLDDFKRVVEPDGLIIFSTNSREHASLRHTIERLAAMQVAMSIKKFIAPIRPPASGFYLEDIPQLVERLGGLEIIDNLEQKSYAKITEGERLDLFRDSIKYSANYTDLPVGDYKEYRTAVEGIIGMFSERIFGRQKQSQAQSGEKGELYLTDIVHRGMFVLRNVK